MGHYLPSDRTTDRVTTSNRMTLLSPTADYVGHSFQFESEQLLEKFFQVCQVPNDAEIVMLSTVCESGEVWVRRWCKSSDRLLRGG